MRLAYRLISLQTLLKTRVLNMSPTGQITGKTVFSLNPNFKSRRAKVNVNVRIEEQQRQESRDTHKIVEDDRKLQIQAAIVRIMKARKQLKHTALMSEVIHQLQNRFKPKYNIPLLLSLYISPHSQHKDFHHQEVYRYFD